MLISDVSCFALQACAGKEGAQEVKNKAEQMKDKAASAADEVHISLEVVQPGPDQFQFHSGPFHIWVGLGLIFLNPHVRLGATL